MPTRLDKVSLIVLQLIILCSTIFFIPAVGIPFQTAKSAFILYGIVLLLVLWLVARLKDGLFHVPKSLWYASTGVLGIAYALAGLFSASHATSIAGTGFELGTLAFFIPSLVLFALVPLVVRSHQHIFYSYITILGSFFIVALFHVVRFIFGADVLTFGIFTTETANFIGKWNDLGIFLGLVTMVSLVSLERVRLTPLFKVLVYIGFIVSLALLVCVNFAPIWVVLAVLSLVFFVYELSFGKVSREASMSRNIPYHTLAVLVVSVFFAFMGARIGGFVSDALGTSQVEIRPSWNATLDVSGAAVAKDPLFGTGPNRFSDAWLTHKPVGINSTQFYNVDFNYGVGFIPSFLATTGIVGFVSVLLFVVLFLVLVFKALLRPGASPFSRYLVLSSLFGSVYLWVFSVLYVPSSSIWILTIIFSGLFLASLRDDKLVSLTNYSVLNKPAASFVSVLITILVLIGALSFGYFVTVKFLAATNFQKAVIAANTTGNLDTSEQYLAKALTLSPNDAYYRSLAELYLLRMNAVVQDDKLSQEEAQTKFQNTLSIAIQAAQSAVAADPTSYENYLELGRVFEAVVPFEIEGAYENAKKSYEVALTVNPESPEIYLLLARLEVANKDNAAAKAMIAKALEKKSDYADAIFLLSQIQIEEKNVPEAIKSVSDVARLSPTDPGIFFQLGLLYYNQKEYSNAVLALERAVTLNTGYANAKYFLGLSYYFTNQKDKALSQFKEILTSNPDNAELKAAIANLEAGKSPLVAPASSAPLGGTKPPVQE